jgi:hypothetical protein
MTNSTGNLFAKSCTWVSGSTCTWANVDGGAALGTSLATTSLPYDFAYDKLLTPYTFIEDGTNPANKSLGPNATNQAIDSFTLRTNTGADTVTGLTFAGNANLSSTNISSTSVRIFRDSGTTSNDYDASDTLIGAGTLSGNTVTFTGLNIAVSTTAQQYIVVANTTASPTDGATITGNISAATSTNARQLLDSSSATITITNDVTPAAMATGFVAGEGELGQSTLSWTNPADSDFYGIRILRRSDNTYPTGPTDANATVVWEDYTNPIATTYTDTSLTNGTRYHYAIFTRDITGNWRTTVTEGINADTAVPGPTVTISNPAVTTINTVYQGQTNNVMQRLTLATNSGTATLNSLTIRNNGTSALDSDVSAVRVYRDTGTLGTLDGDTQIGSGAFSSDVATISSLTESITTTGLNILIVFDISANAATGFTVGSRIASQADLTITGAASVGTFSNHNGQTPTIAGDIVTTTNTAISTSITNGAVSRVMQKLDFATNYGTASLTGISVTKLGTLADAQVTSVGIYSDLDNNNAINGSDALIGSGTFTSGVANITFGTAQAVTTTASHYLVAYTISPSATVGATIGSRIATASALTIAAPDTAAAFATTNYDSNTLTLTEAPDTLTVTPITVTNSSQQQGASNVVLNRLNLAASTGNGITLNGVSITKTGTIADTNVTALRLVRDTDQNGSVNTGDVTLASTTLSSSAASFTGLT